jgi:gas vesicle protein
MAERDRAIAERDEAIAAHTHTAIERNQIAAERDEAIVAHTQTAIERDQIAAERNQIILRSDAVLRNYNEVREKLGIFVESYKNIIRAIAKINVEGNLSTEARKVTSKLLDDMVEAVHRAAVKVNAEEKELHQAAEEIQEDIKELNKKEMVLGLKVMHM